MIYLERDSSRLYFELSRYFLYSERLSWTHFLDRMLALKSMCEPSDPIYKQAFKILNVEDWGDDDLWSSDDEFGSGNAVEDEGDIDDENPPGLSRDKNGDIQFLSKKKGLKDWHFHQYDVDNHPSIPHGHFMGKSQPKLDSYLGWVYQKSKQKNRLSRDLIIELWNDEEFRIFAKIAIEWYQKEFTYYKWRVNDPLRLPRRR